MPRIGVRELRQHASRYLAMVKAGASVEVTVRGQLVALLVPPGATSAARDRLVTSGRLVPASAPFVTPGRRAASAGGAASATLDELRDERLA